VFIQKTAGRYFGRKDAWKEIKTSISVILFPLALKNLFHVH